MKIRRTSRQNAESALALAEKLTQHAANTLLLAEEHAEDASDFHAAQAEHHAREDIAARKLRLRAQGRRALLDQLAGK